jgi:hypothetical protein
MSTFSNLRPSKIYPNWYFWFENKPSGNPAMMMRSFTGKQKSESADDEHPANYC